MKKTVRIAPLLMLLASVCILTAYAADASQKWELVRTIQVPVGERPRLLEEVAFSSNHRERLLARRSVSQFSLDKNCLILQDIQTSEVVDTVPRASDIMSELHSIVVTRISPDKAFLVSSVAENDSCNMYLWNVCRGENGLLRLSNRLVTNVNSHRLEFHPDSKHLAVGYSSRAIRLFSIEKDERNELTISAIKEFLSGGDVLHMAFSPNGAILAVDIDANDIMLLSVNNGDSLATVHVESNYDISQIIFSPDSRYLACRTWNGINALWELSEQDHRLIVKHKKTSGSGSSGPRIIMFSSDSKCLASFAEDDSAPDYFVELYDIADDKVVGTLPVSLYPKSIAFDGEGGQIAVGSDEGKVELFQRRVQGF